MPTLLNLLRNVIVACGFVVLTGTNAVAVEYLLIPSPPVGVLPGAFGSRWQSEVWLYNAGDTPLTVGRIPAQLPNTFTLPAHATKRVDEFPELLWFADRAALLAVYEDGADLKAQLTVRELSTQKAWGFEVPVVRTSDFFATGAHLMNIPIDEQFRVAVRVYVDALHETEGFLLRLSDMEEPGEPVLERHIVVRNRGALPPAYVDSSMRTGSHSEIFDFARTHTRMRRARLEVIPETAGIRFWAFASVTDNQTQYVTVIVPK